MKISSLHRWDLPVAEAIALQKRLASKVRMGRLARPPRTIAGTDVSVGRVHDEPWLFASVVVLSYPALEVIETAESVEPAPFPYVPGLLSFRETPVLLKAFEKLSKLPDLVMSDGQGICHPRRFGLAAHVGLLLDLPAIGVAKSPLFGTYRLPGRNRGEVTPIRQGNEILGEVVRSREGVNPLFVSVGHRITLAEAVLWVLRCCTRYRLPEPTRQAHLHSNLLRLRVFASSFPLHPAGRVTRPTRRRSRGGCRRLL